MAELSKIPADASQTIGSIGNVSKFEQETACVFARFTIDVLNYQGKWFSYFKCLRILRFLFISPL